MRTGRLLWAVPLLLLPLLAAGQTPGDLVRTAVNTELAADANDHPRWLYYDEDAKPNDTVREWVADTASGSLHRELVRRGQPVPPDAQRRAMDRFIRDAGTQEKQRKAGQHDDKQAEDMLRLLPEAFTWTAASAGRSGSIATLHFVPNPGFKPPSWSARVFAAMEGDMQVDTAQHRIVLLKGRLVRDVRFCGGLCGNLAAGGTFEVRRREIGPRLWQIVESHIHIHGSALFFKNISQEEDEQKTRFHRLPDGVTLQQAEDELLRQTE